MHAAALDAPLPSYRPWIGAGLVLLAYSLAGNWLVLPGYRRFLEGGGSAGHGASDLALIWGATRTILWMLSFHLGALFLAYGALAAQGPAVRRFRRLFVAGGALWLALWAIPHLPGPYTALFAGVGTVILLLTVAAFLGAASHARRDAGVLAPRGEPWLIAAMFFFALATWDVCGLGSVGRILRPADELRAASQDLVVTQATKLLVELALAWTLLAVAILRRSRAA
ncbi:hypothetical protein [Zavarzinia sp. CC-PAN008]|uniref:hypothetical protein n=1 Tax=Zavarzinia sp. CC-PAN008 TaxID=3243332 RepID=UPI003F7485E8